MKSSGDRLVSRTMRRMFAVRRLRRGRKSGMIGVRSISGTELMVVPPSVGLKICAINANYVNNRLHQALNGMLFGNNVHPEAKFSRGPRCDRPDTCDLRSPEYLGRGHT